MGDVPTSQAEFEAGVENMAPEAQQVEEAVGSCITTVEDVEPPSLGQRFGELLLTAVFPLAGGYFLYRDIKLILANKPAVLEKLNEAGGGVGDILSEIGQLLSPGNPFAMKAMATSWDEINRILTGTVGPMSDSFFYAPRTWTDSVGVRYAGVPSQQKGALEGLIPHVGSMREYLRQHADTLIKHWWDLCLEITDLVIDAIPLASKFISANPLKWLDVAEPIAQCIARVLKAVRNIANLLFEFTMESNSQIEVLNADVSNVTGSVFGKWPEAAFG